jgi:hypothetical protein
VEQSTDPWGCRSPPREDTLAFVHCNAPCRLLERMHPALEMVCRLEDRGPLSLRRRHRSGALLGVVRAPESLV